MIRFRWEWGSSRVADSGQIQTLTLIRHHEYKTQYCRNTDACCCCCCCFRCCCCCCSYLSELIKYARRAQDKTFPACLGWHWGLGVGDWALGTEDWGRGIGMGIGIVHRRRQYFDHAKNARKRKTCAGTTTMLLENSARRIESFSWQATHSVEWPSRGRGSSSSGGGDCGRDRGRGSEWVQYGNHI